MMKVYIPGMGVTVDENEGPNIGVWMFYGGTAVSHCSQCGGKYYNEPTKYCPNCGALMFNRDAAVEHFGKAYKAILDGLETSAEGGALK